MQVLDVVAIKFVGKTQARKDNICGTDTTWNFPGDIKLVSKDHAERLAVYADTWEKVPIPSMEAPTMQEVQKEIIKAAAGDKNTHAEKQDSKTREEKIAAAILALEKDNENHFTSAGKPKIDALRSAISDISSAEVGRIWQVMNKGEK